MNEEIDKSAEISKQVLKKITNSLEFIIKQIIRFSKMSASEHISYIKKNPRAGFCTIPHPSGKGEIYCGIDAWDKLYGLTDTLLSIDEGLRKSVDRQRAKNSVTTIFTKLILKENRDINQETVKLVIEETLNSLRDSLVVNEHYFPCVLFTDWSIDEFSVGPVKFTRRTNFFKEKKADFKRSVELNTESHIEFVNATVAKGFSRDRAYKPDESRKMVRDLQARAIKLYRDYPWVASIKVTACDTETSQVKAVRVVEMALHVVRILLGSYATSKLRLAWSHSDPLHTAHLHSDANDVIQVSLSVKSSVPVGVVNWHEALKRGSMEIEVFGLTLNAIVDPVETHHLKQRMIDAISWFGDAATDLNPSSSIVKYVTVIERLFFGEFSIGRTKQFSSRVQCILDAFGANDDKRAHEHATEVYKTRSTLLHGMLSPTDETLKKLEHQAESLSRLCLLCATQLYPMMFQAFKTVDPAKLEEVMKRINEEGIQWLVKASGFVPSAEHP